MWNRATERCYHFFPCLIDPVQRSSLGFKVVLVMLHLMYIGVLFLFNRDLIETTSQKVPWYTALYLLLFLAAVSQYFFTAGSSPGYVIDAMRINNQAGKTSMSSNENGGLVITVDDDQLNRNVLEGNATSWTKQVMGMYPSESSVRTWTCTYCNVVQPPRAKHCNECDKCVLQFDHHCAVLGTCIGQGNHCRFWWYICEETVLCLWTVILYIITYKKSDNLRAWWMNGIILWLLISLTVSFIILLSLLLFHSYIILTNQTTYELVRRRRIPYLREIPERVCPFSRGIRRNIFTFCCATVENYYSQPLPTSTELAAMSIPYSCSDIFTCRCCY